MNPHWPSLLVAGTLDSLTCWSLAFLTASGLTVVFGMLGFLNVAHASFVMLAGYLAYSVVAWTGSFWLALLIVPPVVAILGLAAERALFRRLHRAGHTAQLLLTLGLAYVIAEGSKTIWGDSALTVQPPLALAGHVAIAGATLPIYYLFIILTAVLLIGGLALVLRATRIGMVIRAAAVHPQMVEALGFKLAQIHALVFGSGLMLAAVAGIVMTPMVGAYPSMADDSLVQAFIVVVAGGLGSLEGAFVVAGLLGILQGFGSLFLSDYAMFFPFVILGGVLLVRPLGLFGSTVPA